jgi:hypothetical protein
MTFGSALENLITCSPFTLIALAWLLSVCCMSQQLERSLFMCRLDWILLLIIQCGGNGVLKEVALPLRAPHQARTPPGPPPPTPPGETGLMMPMTPPELLGPAPGTPDSVWSHTSKLMIKQAMQSRTKSITHVIASSWFQLQCVHCWLRLALCGTNKKCKHVWGVVLSN